MPSTLPRDPAVAAVFESYPKIARQRLLTVRRALFDVAQSDERIGPLTETLKWGEPAYLTEATRTGSTLRIAWKTPARAPAPFLFIGRPTSLPGQPHRHLQNVFPRTDL